MPLEVHAMDSEFVEKLRRGGVNYCALMEFTTSYPLPEPIYSNGLVATMDLPDRIAHQMVLVPQNGSTPDVTDCRATLIEIDTASVYDFATGKAYVGNYRRHKVNIAYRGDRIVYQLAFHPN